MVHVYAGNLLMTTGSYDDALKAFGNANQLKKSALALYQRAKCHVALNNLESAIADLSKVLQISPHDKVATADKECLVILKSVTMVQSSVSNGGNTFVTSELSLNSDRYEKALLAITKLIEYEKNDHMSRVKMESSIMHQHTSVIPNAQNTKLDKLLASRRRKE